MWNSGYLMKEPIHWYYDSSMLIGALSGIVGSINPPELEQEAFKTFTMAKCYGCAKFFKRNCSGTSFKGKCPHCNTQGDYIST